jgi:hypothetical protein
MFKKMETSQEEVDEQAKPGALPAATAELAAQTQVQIPSWKNGAQRNRQG